MNLIQYIIVLALLLIIDLPVIMKINKDMYMNQLRKINNGEVIIDQNKYLAGFICYMLLSIGIIWFVIKPNQNKSLKKVFLNGALLGFIIYGVYNSTNKATINKWGLCESLVDTIWGSLLIGIVSVITKNLFN